MHPLQIFARRLRRRHSVAEGIRVRIQHPRRVAHSTHSGKVQIPPFAKLIQTAVVLVGCIPLSSVAVVAHADSLTITDAPPAPPLEATLPFVAMPVGAFVRVKCTAPAMDLNNAKLLAVTKTTITVVSVTGERFNLPRYSTVVEEPVNWKRTTGMLNEPPPPPKRGSRGWVVPVLLLSGVSVAGGFWLVRRRQTPAEKPALRAATPRPIPAEPPTPKTEPESVAIENLIEDRCYGTAIERLEQQIKLQPDEFNLRLQLLKVHSIIDNRKQVDRVLRQIEFHPRFSAEQKQQAQQILSPAKRKEGSSVQTGAPPGQTPGTLSQQSST